MPSANELYAQWAADPSDANLNALLSSARAQAVRQARIKAGRDAAEDIAQDALINIHTTLEQYDPQRSSFTSWIWRKTSDVVDERYRKQQRRPVLVLHAPELPDGPYYQLPHDSVVYLLIQGHSLAECGRILGKTRKALRCHLNKLQKQGPISARRIR